MMDWQKLLTPQRLGKTEPEDIQKARTPFHKDYDRLVFSSPFRRLKDKTQVFSLPKNDYIRTRLIHSLEVSCVGRSLGRMVGYEVISRHDLEKYGFSAADFGDIVSAACLAHDIGNPPFGHSGENAIRLGFASYYKSIKNLRQHFLNTHQQADFDLFEGNAQGFRVVTKLEMQPRKGGMGLTCPTLAAFTKYPRESFISELILDGYSGCSIKKYGFFQAEKDLFAEVAETVGLVRRRDNASWWCRHPLAFLVEAADDICYSIVDIEDACRMGYIPFRQAQVLLNEIAEIDLQQYDESNAEKLKRLRGKCIDKLIGETAEIFLENEIEILSGEFDENLLSLSSYTRHLKEISETVRTTVFQHSDVVGMRIAGYEVLGKLFAEFMSAVLQNTEKGELVYYMLPQEYRPEPEENTYNKMLRITDYISGMTDYFATSLFQKLSGISLG